MRQLLLILLVALAYSQTTQAQTPPYFSGNTSIQANIVPLNPGSTANFQKSQDLYGPGEFTGAPAGTIETLWIRVASTSALGGGPYSDFQVSMGQNVGTDNTVTSTFNTGLVPVFSAASYTTSAAIAGGWIAIPLSSPFSYNPALSLVIEVKSTGSPAGLNVYRSNLSNRRVYGPPAATTGTEFSGPMEVGLSINAAPTPPYFSGNTSIQANIVPLNPGSTANFQKSQDLYGPGEFTGAPAGTIETLWIRVASTSALGGGPYSDFQVSMGQNVGTDNTVTSTFNTGLVPVFSAASYTTSAAIAGGWIAIPLSSPFSYNPALSLVIEVKSTGSPAGLNVYRSNLSNRRVYGPPAATTGTEFSGPMEVGLSINAAPTPPYFSGNTSIQANIVPLNPGSTANFQKSQDLYGPGEFTGAPAGTIETLWIRVASTSALGGGPYSDFQVSMGQNVGTDNTVTSTFNTGLVPVFSAASYTTSAAIAGGWIAIPLSSPFSYNPALSLVIEVKSTGSPAGLNVYRSNLSNRRVYGPPAATTGTEFSGPMEVGLSINAAPTPPYFSGNTSIQANIVPLNPGSTANFQKSQDLYGPGEFTGAPAGTIETLWIRVASTSALGGGPYSDFQVSMGQNVGISNTVTSTFNTGLVPVFSAASYTTSAAIAGGWIAIPLSSPFSYNPALSLVIEVKSTGSPAGLNVYRSNLSNRRVYGPPAATTGTEFSGPMEVGISMLNPSVIFKNGFE